MRRGDANPIFLRTIQTLLCQGRRAGNLKHFFYASSLLCSVDINHYSSQDRGSLYRLVKFFSIDADLGADVVRVEAIGRFHVHLPDGIFLFTARALVAMWSCLAERHWAAQFGKVRCVILILEVVYHANIRIRRLVATAVPYLSARATHSSFYQT